MVFQYGVLVSCLLYVVFVYGVAVCFFRMVLQHGVFVLFVWCFSMVFAFGVFVWCFIMLYGVLVCGFSLFLIKHVDLFWCYRPVL